MTGILPPGIDAEDEISIVWDRTEERTLVTAELGDAKITVETTSDEGVTTAPWLVASLPDIMNAAWDAIEAEEEERA